MANADDYKKPGILFHEYFPVMIINFKQNHPTPMRVAAIVYLHNL